MVFISRTLYKSFITTPIFYVNAAPHIGHLYTVVLADAAHRWQKLLGGASGECILSTGTDEHGLKIQQAAQEHGCPPRELCDNVSMVFKDLFDKANISYNYFIRTTNSNHISLVQQIWTELYKRGFIYNGTYSGWYSVADETFLSESQITDGTEPGSKISIETGHNLEWSSEENYMFKLSLFQDDLLKWITTKPYPIIPEPSRQQVLNMLSHTQLEDLSVSRPSSRLQWGVAIPNDNTQTIYVWLDALVNYLTVSQYPDHTHFWPATVHIVGKDILRFHSIYWPSFLLALGLALPHKIVCHSHWTVNKNKMSKSKGNVIDPFNQLNQFGIDPLRYFLLKESSLHQDGDYSDERLINIINSDLADTLGNLLSRLTSPKLHPQGIAVRYHPNILNEEDNTLLDSLKQLSETVRYHYNLYQFGQGLTAIMNCLHMTNRLLERHKPWSLVNDPTHYPRLETVLAVAMESLRLSAVLLTPVVPETSATILTRLGLDPTNIGPNDLQSVMEDQSIKCPVIGGPPLLAKIKL